MMYDFVRPSSDEEWQAYHDIRRTVLFENRGRVGVYDPHHPDEFMPNHHPRLFLIDRQPIGVVRIDMVGTVAWLRRVAIAQGFQRSGHGRLLLKLSEQFARTRSATRVESSVAADAVGFYRRCGYMVRSLSKDAPSVLMVKELK